MAIMEASHTSIEGGFEKIIEASAMGIVLDMAQKSQYQYPLKSSIRELVSNALDAIKEREAAVQILSGTAQVSDFYEEREGEIYEDSKFDFDYYDTQYLSTDPNVYITYVEGKAMEKDKIIIKDNGVGLGKYRLEKYFNIGWSSKRLSRLPLGKFGVGAKAPLSLNPYYTMQSCYNGEVFRFNIYDARVESITPRFNLETGLENKSYILPNKYKLYCEPTTQKNGVTITIEAKKTYMSQIKDVVENQLLYFSNVIFNIHHADNHNEEVDFKADVVYEDDLIILANSKYYNKPHILLNKVNYGYIDWGELELEDKEGNIGIKVQPEDVEVHPSRERLIWNEKTKAKVVERFKSVVDIASRLVEKELQQTDFLAWVKACYNVSTRYTNKSNGSILERLSLLVDFTNIKPKFSDTDLRFTAKLFDSLKMQKVIYETTRKANKPIQKISRTELFSLGFQLDLPVILAIEKANNRKEKYLLSLYPQGFVKIKPPLWLNTTLSLVESTGDEWASDYRKEGEQVWNLFCASKGVLRYEDIEVPEDFKGTDLEEDELTDQIVTPGSDLSHEERRKIEGKVVLHTPRWVEEYPRNEGNILEWQKVEVPVKEVDDWDEEEIYYGNDADKDVLQFVTLLTRNTTHEDLILCRHLKTTRRNSAILNDHNFYYEGYDANESVRNYEAYRCTHFFENPKIKLIKVSQQTTKLYTDFLHINNFFQRVENNTLTMSNLLIQWNTARQIKENLHKLNFLWNYPFDEEKQATFKELVAYVKDYYREVKDLGHHSVNETVYDQLIAHLDKVQQFQLVVQNGATAEEISHLAQEMWKTDTIKDGCALDLETWTKFQGLLEWSEPVRVLLNEMHVLTGITDLNTLQLTRQYQSRSDVSLSEEVQQSLASYVKSKLI